MYSRSIFQFSTVLLLLFSMLPVAADTQGEANKLSNNESVKAIASEVVPANIHSEVILEEKINKLREQIQSLREQEMSLIKQKMQLLKGQAGLTWQDASEGKVPKNSVACAYSKNKPVYICRAAKDDNIFPGQLSDTGCMLVVNGNVTIKKDYQVLSGLASLQWKSPKAITQVRRDAQYYRLNPGKMAAEKYMHDNLLPIRAGDHNGKAVYICRGIHQNNIALGHVHDRFCIVAANNQVQRLANYEILFASR